MTRIKVVIVDDHAIFRRGVKSLLSDEPDIAVVGEAGNAAEALDTIGRTRPDVASLDIRLGGMDGIQLARLIGAKYPAVKIIILSTYEERQYLVGALDAEVSAYLLKTTSYETLAQAIRTVHAGERMLSPELVPKMMEDYQRMAVQQMQRDSGLSAQEIRVLRLLAKGETSQTIATHLSVSEITVKRRVQEIVEKLHATNRVQAVAEAFRRGLI